MTERIYKVKYSRTSIHDSRERMPYDLWYVVPLSLLHTVDRMFDYWWEIACTPDLIHIMSTYPVSYQVVLPTKGRKKTDVVVVTVDKIIPWDTSDWVMVVPTYVTKPIVDTKLTIQYLWTRHTGCQSALHEAVQDTIKESKLHMKGVVINSRCYRCVNLLKYHNGECSPGNKECLLKAKVTVPARKESANGDSELVS